MTQLKTIAIDSLRLFYRRAGNPNAPAILLLHGFPSSSHQYRNLIPLLAENYFVIAPDLPGFGFSSAPSHTEFSYTFDNLAAVVEKFTEQIGLARFALYVFDYGAPIGWRLALNHPERITAIVSQNGNGFEEGLSEAWQPIRKYWAEESAANRDALRGLLSLEMTKFQYQHGTPDPEAIAPEAYWLDFALLERPGNADIQLDLFRDYQTNVALYPKLQEYLRSKQPPVLAVWGKNDPFFLPEGAIAFTRENANARYVLLDTGHFALETHVELIAKRVSQFLTEVLGKEAFRASRSPRETVEAFYRNLLAGDSAKAFDNLSTDVQWTSTAGFPHGGVYGSRAEVIDLIFAPMLREWTRIELVPERFLDSGNEVTALGFYEGVHAGTGKAMRARFSHTFTVVNGLITRFDHVSDTHRFREAAR